MGTQIIREMLETFAIPSKDVAYVMLEQGEEQELIGKFAGFDLDEGVLITAPMVISPESLPPLPPIQ